MAFNSLHFLIFFPIVILVYYIMPKKLRTFWLLAASYYFYMAWNPKYIVLILISTLATYLSGLLLEKFESIKARKGIVAGCFVINLSLLFFFKYFDFLLSNINFLLEKMHISVVANPFDVLLPVGISFYTFQALSYTVDVCRKEIKAERNFLRYALFVSFFPQLVAGPIERSKNLLSQIENLDDKKLFDYDKVVSGFSMMVYGMFLKVVLADHISIFVDNVWENTHAVGSTVAILAAIAFSLQIYCDFGAYSIIAIGAARMLGISLMENFNTPYFATSISDFWRRWHVSLSTWFRDYLYIPLGGSRCSKVKKYRNIMITFLVSGLWHGANWTYVIWGAIHGMYQIVGDLLKPIKERLCKITNVNKEVGSFRLLKILVTFALTTFAWIFFRADSLKAALLFIKNMIARPDPWVLSTKEYLNFGVDASDLNLIIIGIIVLVIVDLIRYKKNLDIGAFLLKQNLWFRWAVLIVLIVSTLVYGAYGTSFDSSQFIYFQF